MLVRRLRSFRTLLCRPTRFFVEREGASLAEYTVLLGVVIVVLITGVSQFSRSIGGLASRTTTALAQDGSGAGPSGSGSTGGGNVGSASGGNAGGNGGGNAGGNAGGNGGGNAGGGNGGGRSRP